MVCVIVGFVYWVVDKMFWIVRMFIIVVLWVEMYGVF